MAALWRNDTEVVIMNIAGDEKISDSDKKISWNYSINSPQASDTGKICIKANSVNYESVNVTIFGS